MQTIEVQLAKREPKRPDERYIPAWRLKLYLANVRQKTFMPDTFRRWRKVAQVTSSHFYTEFEQARLAAVARHLLEGKPLKSKSLEIQIKRIISLENNYEL